MSPVEGAEVDTSRTSTATTESKSKETSASNSPDVLPLDYDIYDPGNCHKLLPTPNAPNGKPKVPPLLHKKVKPNEAGATIDDISPVCDGSKIPILKSKQSLESIASFESKSHLLRSTAMKRNVVCNKVQAQGVKPKLPTVQRSYEKIKISRGIEMKRIVQEFNDDGGCGSGSGEPPLSRVGSKTNFDGDKCARGNQEGRKMKKVEAAFTDVKSFSRVPQLDSAVVSSKNSRVSQLNSTKQEKKMNVQLDNKAQSTPTPVKPVENPASAPTTAEPDNSAPKTLYKSKFWDYIDPNKNTGNQDVRKNVTKAYDQEKIKEFMQKQKQIRQLQQKKEFQEKQKNSVKRQQMLKSLDEKCHRLAFKRKSVNVNPVQCSKPKSVKSETVRLESSNLKYFKPLLTPKQVPRVASKNSNSEVSKQSQLLLAEFENIVKRECISFLHKIPKAPSGVLPEIKADKAVGTNGDLAEDIQQGSSEDHQNQNGPEMQEETSDRDRVSVTLPEIREKAVQKIQAAYRGYKIRRAFHEAGIVFKDHSHSCFDLNGSKSAVKSKTGSLSKIFTPDQFWRQSPAPRFPEKPYDRDRSNSLSKRVLPLSPIPMMNANATNSNPNLIPSYIPLPFVQSLPTASPSKSFTFLHTPRRVFNEPYPARAQTSPGATVDRSCDRNRLPSSNTPSENKTPINHTLFSIPRPPPDFGLYNMLPPAPSPSVGDAFCAKIRASTLFKETEAKASSDIIPPPPPQVSTSSSALQSDLSDSGSKSSKTSSKLEKPRKSRRKHSRKSSASSEIPENSGTTIDTDMESGSQSQTQMGLPPATPTTSTSNRNLQSTTLTEGFLAPALLLRYEAEKERLQMLEKALQLKIGDTSMTVRQRSEEAAVAGPSTSKAENKSESSLRVIPESNRVQLAIANCQKESMKAAAEMVKWMSDFQKATQERNVNVVQQNPVDMAALIYAAVEQVKNIESEMRLKKKDNEDGKKAEAELAVSKPTAEERRYSASGSGYPLDKSTEMSVALAGPVSRTGPVLSRFSNYQQQFPSESSTSSKEVEADADISVHSSVSEHITKASKNSRPSSAQNLASFNIESLEYASLMPSGNTVEISSLGHVVSSVDGALTISSEQSLKSEEKIIPPVELASLSHSEIPKSVEEASSLKDESVDVDLSREVDVDDEFAISHATSELKTQTENEKSSPRLSSIQIEDEIRSTQSKTEVPVDEAEANLTVVSDLVSDQNSEIKTAPEEEEGNETASDQEQYVYDEASFDNEDSFLNEDEDTYKNEENQESLDEETPEIPQEVSMKADEVSQDLVSDRRAAESEVEESVNEAEGSVSEFANQRKDEGEVQPGEEEPEEEEKVISADLSVSDAPNTQQKVSLKKDEEISESSEPEIEIKNENNKSQDVVQEVEEEEEKKLNESKNMNAELSPKNWEKISEPDASVVYVESEVTTSEEKSLGNPTSEKGDGEANVCDSSSHSHTKHSESFASTAREPDVEVENSELDDDANKSDLDNASMSKPNVLEESPVAASLEQEQVKENETPPTPKDEVFPVEIPESLESVTEDFSVDDDSSSLQETEPKPKSSESEEEKAEEDAAVEIEVDKPREKTVIEDAAAEPEPQVVLEPEIIAKLPPPYSPSSSLDSTSLSSRSLMISLQSKKLQRIIADQVDMIWTRWGSSGEMPELDWVTTELEELNKSRKEDENENFNSTLIDRTGNFDAATENFDVLLNRLIYENIKEVLQVECPFTSFIERVRPGPLALRAQKLRVPRRKDDLVAAVLKGVVKSIPGSFISDMQPTEGDKPGSRKWCSRSRELVDEILLEEFVKEDFQWTEWWPEEIIVVNNISTNIVKNTIRAAVKNRKYVFSGQQ